MAYTKQTWTNGSSKLNATRMQYIEDGLEAAAIVADAAIPKAISGVATDKVPVYNGSAWVAQKIVNAQVDPAAAIAYSKLNLTGSIVDADISGSAAIALSKLAAAAWTSFTPSWTSSGTAPALGNGTLTGKYIQIGKLVVFRIAWTAGSTTTFGTGTYSFSLPVNYAGTSYHTQGGSNIVDASPAGRYAATTIIAASTLTPEYYSVNGTNVVHGSVTNTTPITFASGDAIFMSAAYEAA